MSEESRKPWARMKVHTLLAEWDKTIKKEAQSLLKMPDPDLATLSQ